MARTAIGVIVTAVAVAASPPAHAAMPFGNFSMVIPQRHDFHTWAWAVASCVPAAADCVYINAIPMPIAKAFEYRGQAYLADGRYTLTVDIPDGLRCGNVYYGPVIPTRDVYSWDAVTLQGTVESSFAAGCGGAPAGTFSYPFSLVRM